MTNYKIILDENEYYNSIESCDGRSFNYYSKIHSYLSEFEKLFSNENISNEEKDIFGFYTKDEGVNNYHIINDALRNGILTPELESTIKTMTNIINKNRLNDNVVLYRGLYIDTKELINIGLVDSNLVFNSGKVVLFKGFLSTTMDLYNVATFYKHMHKNLSNKSKVLLKLKLPIGTTYYKVKDSANPEEHEIVLNPNLKFKLLKEDKENALKINKVRNGTIDFIFELQLIS